MVFSSFFNISDFLITKNIDRYIARRKQINLSQQSSQTNKYLEMCFEVLLDKSRRNKQVIREMTLTEFYFSQEFCTRLYTLNYNAIQTKTEISAFFLMRAHTDPLFGNEF